MSLIQSSTKSEGLPDSSSEPTLGSDGWDWSRPFTIGEMFQHFAMGNPHDASRTKPVVAKLMEKGYTKRMVKMGGTRENRYAKWAHIDPLVIPEIP